MSRRGLARVLAAAAMAGSASLVASCNVVLSLDKYHDCPGDPSCPTEPSCEGTGVDCGGSCPARCPTGQACESAADCEDGPCTGHVCVASTCTDGVLDGQETDVDCGGPTCPKCGEGKKCATPSDCATGVNGQPTCTGGTCGFACASGFADCDKVVGCETDDTTTSNCGACGVKCSAYCTSGECNDPVALASPGGFSQTCAILKDGSLWCWGGNMYGEVGDGTTTNRPSPTKIDLGQTVTAVSANGVYTVGYVAHTCALLADKTLRCWGDNQFGELGVGDANVHASPEVVALPNVAQVAVGGLHTCAVDTSQNLYCWGYNGGSTGDGTTTPSTTMPAMVMSSVVKVACGAGHTCVIKTDGNLYCWGTNSDGEVGLGTMTDDVQPADTGIVSMSNGGALGTILEAVAGDEATCARSGIGVFCWGNNQYGQLGIGSMGTTTNQDSPVALSLPSVTQLAFGSQHAGAVTAAGPYLWGWNDMGQLGDGNPLNSDTPVLVPLPGTASLGLAFASSCALTTSHELYCWGYNAGGALGNGTTTSSATPIPVVWP